MDETIRLFSHILSSCQKAKLMVVGQGGDPHGFGPLETIMRSALAVAGFRLEEVLPCIGESCGQACERVLEMIG